MRQLCLALVAIVAISAPVLAQCSTLTVAGSINAGQTITIDVSGATANSIAFIAVGDAGTTTIPFPGNPLTLGVIDFIVLPIGITDASGHASISVDVPPNIPAALIHDHTFTVQALTASFSFGSSMPSLTFCVSNTATLVSGNG